MKKCENCDNQFVPTKNHPTQRFCSFSCAKYVRGRRRFGLGPIKKKLVCAVCEKEFVQKRLNNTQYCDCKCKRLGVMRRSRGLEVKGPRKHTKGSGYITSSGYKILSKKHPNSSKRGQILEHVLIMSDHLGRPLRDDETVHHKNGIRNDNRIENLELWSHSHPPGQRVEDKLSWCKGFLQLYGYKVVG